MDPAAAYLLQSANPLNSYTYEYSPLKVGRLQKQGFLNTNIILNNVGERDDNFNRSQLCSQLTDQGNGILISATNTHAAFF
jgi:hypothetical protein